MTARARQPARKPPDPALVELVRALARDAARRDYAAEKAAAAAAPGDRAPSQAAALTS